MKTFTTFQELIDLAKSFPSIEPVITPGSKEPALTITKEVMRAMMETPCRGFRLSTEDYPGQAYFHKHNPNIKRAEERFTK